MPNYLFFNKKCGIDPAENAVSPPSLSELKDFGLCSHDVRILFPQFPESTTISLPEHFRSVIVNTVVTEVTYRQP